jgi:hypothetical protein
MKPCKHFGYNSRRVAKCFAPGGRCQGVYATSEYSCSMKVGDKSDKR